MTQTIQYEVSGSVGTLRIAQESRHNALGAAELDGIEKVLDVIQQDREVAVLVVTGSGQKTFCAGAALDDLNNGLITPESFQATIQRLGDLPIPTLARVNGNVFGGGTELALSCDFRVGIEGTRLRVPAAALGLCYPPAGIKRFVETLGANTARRMLMAAETLGADELYRIGFYDHLVPAESLDERTEELAQHLAGLAPLAVRAMKELIKQAAGDGIDPARAAELSRMCDESDDLQEGLAAQREKRGARFVGG